MGKRFRDTELSNESWYRKLSALNKCVWSFLCDKCDNAGVWVIDTEMLDFFIGESVDLEQFIEIVNTGKERLRKINDAKLYITGFIEFQYGELTTTCIPHRKILSLLGKHGIEYTLQSRVDSTLQEKEEDKEEEKEKDERGSGGKQKSRPNIQPVKNQDAKIRSEYAQVITEVQDMPEGKEQRKRIVDFITDRKPAFIEPYMDLWNLSVKAYGLSQVENISDGRKKKFSSRVREPAFNFPQILIEIHQSQYLRGNTTDWKVDWDWIFENDTNYIKILEGKYRG